MNMSTKVTGCNSGKVRGTKTLSSLLYIRIEFLATDLKRHK
jgi:hypothetical protein